MSILMSIFLGLIQGITEFLPVSSSGHLSIFQNLFKLNVASEDHLLFDVLLHLGTLAAIFVVYWKDIKSIVPESVAAITGRDEEENSDGRLSVGARTMVLIVAATLPLLLIVPFKSRIEGLFNNLSFVGFALVITGSLLFVSTKLTLGRKNEKTSTIVDALIVGLGQALALIPGLSRSGTTITVGLARGFRRDFAVKFSFLMSIPAVLGSVLLTLVDALRAGIVWKNVPAYILGMVVAAVTGYFALRFLKQTIEKIGFKGYAYYCWGLGALVFILGFIF